MFGLICDLALEGISAYSANNADLTAPRIKYLIEIANSLASAFSRGLLVISALALTSCTQSATQFDNASSNQNARLEADAPPVRPLTAKVDGEVVGSETRPF